MSVMSSSLRAIWWSRQHPHSRRESSRTREADQLLVTASGGAPFLHARNPVRDHGGRFTGAAAVAPRCLPYLVSIPLRPDALVSPTRGHHRPRTQLTDRTVVHDGVCSAILD